MKNENVLSVTGVYNQEAIIRLYNMQGKEVFTTNFRVEKVNEIILPKLNFGFYILRLETKSRKVNMKMVLHY